MKVKDVMRRFADRIREAFQKPTADPHEAAFTVPKDKFEIGWTCWEELGVEAQTAPVRRGAEIRTLDGLKVGMAVFVPGPFGGWHKLTVTKVNGHEADAEDDFTLAPLTFQEKRGPEQTPAWVAGCLINKAALARVDFTP